MIGDALFKKLFLESHFYTNKVAAYFEAKGIRARILPHRLRTDRATRFQYSDAGDLEITFHVDVKHRVKVNFTSIEDYPYETVLIDEDDGKDIHTKSLWGIVIVSADGKTGLVVPMSTHSRWNKVVKSDKKQEGKKEREFWEVDKKLCTIISLPSNGEEDTNGKR